MIMLLFRPAAVVRSSSYANATSYAIASALVGKRRRGTTTTSSTSSYYCYYFLRQRRCCCRFRRFLTTTTTSTTTSTSTANAADDDNHHRQPQPSYDQQEKAALLQQWEDLKNERQKDISALPESVASKRFEQFLRDCSRGSHQIIRPPVPPCADGGYKYTMSKSQINLTLDAMLMTFALHLESRTASLLGKSYYTIGPCGEECLAAAAHALSSHDSLALHYRHSGINVARQLIAAASSSESSESGDSIYHFQSDTTEQILLDRARGYTVSKYDPVTGGVHCSIGSRRRKDVRDGGGIGDGEYVVTSTLASQCSPAVGRALGYSLIKNRNNNAGGNKKKKDDSRNNPVSFVTIGDGSVHNSHFWSAYHLARHAKHLQIKCPVIFGIADNGLSISYSTRGYVDTLFDNNNDTLVPVYKANGNDIMDVYDKTYQAVNDYSRRTSSPSVILYQNLTRRFGHAATDRQSAYLSPIQIQNMAESTILESAIVQAVEVYNALTYDEVHDRYKEIQRLTRLGFALASQEPKVTREDMLERMNSSSSPATTNPTKYNSASAVPTSSTLLLLPTNNNNYNIQSVNNLDDDYGDDDAVFRGEEKGGSGGEEVSSGSEDTDDVAKKEQPRITKKDVMRKHMTRVIEESMDKDDSIVYMGEDVRHGGYYLVTDGLVQKFGPSRIVDFPPDETSLLGCAQGFAQLGLLPIVEIPYAKYLDCGADMFYEICITNWLTNNNQSTNGMIIRLQGFDRGLFGGNFHTTNMLQHIPPGIDVVCYSNGEDYVKGFRYAIQLAKTTNRIIMFVDSTNLLNLRHLYDDDNSKDRKWERCYPSLPKQDDDDDNECSHMMGFDEIRIYFGGDASTTSSDATSSNNKKYAIVSYGNGVVTSLQARRKLLIEEEESTTSTGENHATIIDIIDCPYLSGVPQGLRDALKQNNYNGILFADPCKSGPGSSVLDSMACKLHAEGLLPPDANWQVVAAPRTYNPLGSTVTFLNVEDILDGLRQVSNAKNSDDVENTSSNDELDGGHTPTSSETSTQEQRHPTTSNSTNATRRRRKKKMGYQLHYHPFHTTATD